MNYNNRVKNSSTVTIRVTCAIVYVVFSLAWLYCFQADVLAMTQHVMSRGITKYHPAVGTILITALLWLLHLAVYGVVRLERYSHALTYVPSMLALGIITRASQMISGRGTMTSFWWVVIGMTVLWLLGVSAARKLQPMEETSQNGLFSRPVWVNMLLMALTMMCVAGLGNTNAVFHFRAQTEGCLSVGDYGGALEVGRESHESDASLMMLRMYALAKEGKLGEQLFEYPIAGDAGQILPTNGRTSLMMYPADSIYRFMGGRPKTAMEPMRYLELIEQRDSAASRQVADYRLCGLLIDKNLEDFAQTLGRYYAEDSILPKHYQEAMALYRHLYEKGPRPYPAVSKRIEAERLQGTYWYYYASGF